MSIQKITDNHPGDQEKRKEKKRKEKKIKGQIKEKNGDKNRLGTEKSIVKN